MNLEEWAQKWSVPVGALTDLRDMMGMDIIGSAVPSDVSTEAGVSKRVRLQHAKAGGLLWRNNVGAFKDETGRWIRFGLANESTQMNQQIKSSDLIGLMPVEITQAQVGTIIGQFIAIETKAPGWTYKGTPREKAQNKFHELVVSRGGIGLFQYEV